MLLYQTSSAVAAFVFSPPTPRYASAWNFLAKSKILSFMGAKF
jgi:hypothetical protein